MLLIHIKNFKDYYLKKKTLKTVDKRESAVRQRRIGCQVPEAHLSFYPGLGRPILAKSYIGQLKTFKKGSFTEIGNL